MSRSSFQLQRMPKQIKTDPRVDYSCLSEVEFKNKASRELFAIFYLTGNRGLTDATIQKCAKALNFTGHDGDVPESSIRCSIYKWNDMAVSAVTGGRTCDEPTCSKICTFGYEDGKPLRCRKHKYDNMQKVVEERLYRGDRTDGSSKGKYFLDPKFAARIWKDGKSPIDSFQTPTPASQLRQETPSGTTTIPNETLPVTTKKRKRLEDPQPSKKRKRILPEDSTAFTPTTKLEPGTESHDGWNEAAEMLLEKELNAITNVPGQYVFDLPSTTIPPVYAQPTSTEANFLNDQFFTTFFNENQPVPNLLPEPVQQTYDSMTIEQLEGLINRLQQLRDAKQKDLVKEKQDLESLYATLPSGKEQIHKESDDAFNSILNGCFDGWTDPSFQIPFIGNPVMYGLGNLG